MYNSNQEDDYYKIGVSRVSGDESPSLNQSKKSFIKGLLGSDSQDKADHYQL